MRRASQYGVRKFKENVKKKPTKPVRREVTVTGNSKGLRPSDDLSGLLANLRDVIQSARGQALRAVDVVQVRTCWSVGQHIVEFEQGGAARAAYGTRLLAGLEA